MDGELSFLVFRAIGLLGFVTYLGSFIAVQSGHICPRGLTYPGLNVGAALLVLVGLQVEWNLSSALIQLTWIAVGLTTIGRRALRTGSET